MEVTIEYEFDARKIKKTVTLPAYFKYGKCFRWKIVSADTAIKAAYNEFGLSEISVNPSHYPLAYQEIEECTEAEFNTAYDAALNAITSLKK